ncbi:MAG: glycoside hydrolase family 3 C-terminal domain-containing protein, partial [Eubacteriales bacterium]|nr:glycoside hydrolase family 3 C-terminal domain-containing protein [Eubacteriales bacterium]
VLGPACNIKRSPLCGRNFEYLSEDPYLSSKMAKGHILGTQSQGIGTSIKHFLANNQEDRRMTVDTIVDERTLREIYLASFEEAICEAKPWTVMCSYNRLNGQYLSDNKRMLTDILRDEWQYSGIVVSDWGAVNDRTAGVVAGMDLEMPASSGINDRRVIEAVRHGEVTEAAVDVMVGRILDLVYRSLDNLKPDATVDLVAHHNRARELAAQCAVLLKNEGPVLPLRPGQQVAIIGAFAENPRYQGGGSSHINPTRITRAIHEIRKVSPDATFAPGFVLTSDRIDTVLVEEAVANAKAAGTAVIFAGLPDHYESEGYDRKHINLPPNQNDLIAAVTKVCRQVVVVLANGSPVAMPWINAVSAVLEGYLPGQAGGGAITDVLFGKVNPSGKLAETFPLRLEDNPSFLDFPGFNDRVEYREGLHVGYRYYDKRNVDVLFPFGHGLSYTSFAFSDLQVSHATITDQDLVEVSVTVENTGRVAGSEVVQLYLAYPETTVARVPQELKGFAKVPLAAGEKKTIQLTLNSRSFSYYDVPLASWLLENGPVEIRVGASSRDISLTTTAVIKNTRLSKVVFTLNSTRYDLLRHPIANPVFAPFYAQMGSLAAAIGQSKDDEKTAEAPLLETADLIAPPIADEEAVLPEENPFGTLFEEMEKQLPLRALVLLSGGQLPVDLIQSMLDQVNATIAISQT